MTALPIAHIARWRRGYGFLLLATLLSVAVGDWLFYGQPVGWSAGLFAAFLLAVLVVRGGAFLLTRAGVAVWAAAGGMVAALVEEPTPLAVMMAGLFVSMLAVLNRNPWPGGARAWAGRLAASLGFALTRVVTDNRIAARWLRRHPVSMSGPGRVAMAWALPVLLGGVFVALFRAANPIISRVVTAALDRVGDALADVAGLFDLSRNVFWLCLGVAVYALLRVGRGRRRVGDGRGRGRWRVDQGDPAGAEWVGNGREMSAVPGGTGAAEVGRYSIPPRGLSATSIVVRCLVVFNAIFLVQTSLDGVYLLGGAALPEGMTHAEYAHRGAYPLVATALLAGVFVLAAFRPGGAAERSAWARRLVYLWVAQNVFLTFTAAWRLDLYVGAFSLTRLRVAAGIWMLLVAAGLLWIGCRIVFRRDNTWLLNANVLSTLAVLYGCCFVNFDGIIADYNVAHCREAGGQGVAIDLGYLRSLGPDALPALRRAAPIVDTAARRQTTDAYADELEAELREDLHNWRGWTLRRSRTFHAAGL